MHKLKTWPSYFEAIYDGRKTFEFRENDRDFKVGDILLLQEWEPCPQCKGAGRIRDHTDLEDCDTCLGKKTIKGYTGRELLVEVSYILEGNEFGPLRNRCIMSVKLIAKD